MRRNFLMLASEDAPFEDWARAVAAAVPGLQVSIARDRAEALRLLPQADCAFGTLDARCWPGAKLAWLQAPQAAARRYFFSELVVTRPGPNFRGL